MVHLNCAAIPDGLFEAELFGSERGAFTGSVNTRVGRLESVEDGAILFDEIGDLPFELQTKLLRVLEEGEFERIGSNETRKFHGRVISATSCNILERVEAGHFRPDLFYRLSGVHLVMPTIQGATETIERIASNTWRLLNEKYGEDKGVICEELVSDLCQKTWPGNIRELKAAIERAWIGLDAEGFRELPMQRPVALQRLQDVLESVGGNVSRAARILEIPRSTLRYRIERERLGEVDFERSHPFQKEFSTRRRHFEP